MTLRKNNFLLSIIILLASSYSISSAQVVSKGYNSPVMQAFIKGKTYVVLTNDENFNQWLQTVLEKQWKASTLNYISASGLDTFVSSDQNFFLFAETKDDKTSVFHLLTEDDLTRKKEFFILLSQGGMKQPKLLFTPTINGPKILAAFRYDAIRGELGGGMADAQVMICLMNQSIQTVIERKIKTEVKDSIRWTITDENAKQIKDKTLLVSNAYYDESIMQDDKALITDKVLEEYPYSYALMMKDSAAIIMDDESGTVCYLYLYFPTPHLKTTDDSGDIIVYDPTQKKILYFNDNIDGPWIEKWKMKELIAAVKAK